VTAKDGEDAAVTCDGSLFHTLVAVTANALSLTDSCFYSKHLWL